MICSEGFLPDFERAFVKRHRFGVLPHRPVQRREIVQAVGDLTDINYVLEIPFVRLRTLDGLPTMVAAFTTDIPALSNWGQPLLIGPGSIHVAHTESEYVEKKQLNDAVDLYCSIAKRLINQRAGSDPVSQ